MLQSNALPTELQRDPQFHTTSSVITHVLAQIVVHRQAEGEENHFGGLGADLLGE